MVKVITAEERRISTGKMSICAAATKPIVEGNLNTARWLYIADTWLYTTKVVRMDEQQSLRYIESLPPLIRAQIPEGVQIGRPLFYQENLYEAFSRVISLAEIIYSQFMEYRSIGIVPGNDQRRSEALNLGEIISGEGNWVIVQAANKQFVVATPLRVNTRTIGDSDYGGHLDTFL